MLQTVYIDVLLVIDFSMDFLALYITSYLLKLKLKASRNILAAFLGALYSVLTVILKFDSIILTVIFGYFICLAAFGKRKPKESAYIFIAFIAVNFLLGGGMTALFSIFNSVVGERLVIIYGDVSKVPEKLPFNIFAFGAALITAIVMLFAKIFSKKGTAKRVSAEIYIGSRCGEFILTEDSGNMLTEQLSGDPVIFLSERAMLKLTDSRTLYAIKSLEPEIMKKSRLKMRVTVYETVGGKEMCVCLRPDKVVIDGRSVRAWIASGKSESFGDSDGLVPSVLLGG